MNPPELPERVRDLMAGLASAGIRSWVVGGALRDALLGRRTRDFDVVVDAPLDEAARALPAAVRIDAATPVLLCRGAPRVELVAFRGGATDIDSDLRLRDFTVNAIAFDGVRAEWTDPLDGRADLAARRLRATDPERVFLDDPLRVLRGVRLTAELGLETDPATRDASFEHAWRLSQCAAERLRDELFRLLELPDPRPALRALRAVGALSAVLPELLRTVGIEQNRHHPDDVYRHTLRVCALVPPMAELRLAALLHDVAKPDTKARSGKTGEPTFYRHDVRARSAVDTVSERLRLSNRTRERVAGLVRHHLLYPERLETARAIRRMRRRVGDDLLDDLLLLRRADYGSRADDGEPDEAWLATERRIRTLEPGLPELAIDGRDVMETLDLEPGQAVGRWMSRLRSRVVDRPDENDRERLLQWLRHEGRVGETE